MLLPPYYEVFGEQGGVERGFCVAQTGSEFAMKERMILNFVGVQLGERLPHLTTGYS